MKTGSQGLCCCDFFFFLVCFGVLVCGFRLFSFGSDLSWFGTVCLDMGYICGCWLLLLFGSICLMVVG